MNTTPNYKRIYTDLVNKKFPEKREKCEAILAKKRFSFFDIIKINSIVSENENLETELFNQKHRSYSVSDIAEILEYQKKHHLSNMQLAAYFKIARTTLTKWKKTDFLAMRE